MMFIYNYLRMKYIELKHYILYFKRNFDKNVITMQDQNEGQMTYLQLISQDEKNVQEEELKIVAQEAALELNRTKLELLVSIQKANSHISKLMRAVPYNVSDEYDARYKLAELEDKLKFVDAVRASRFSDANFD